MSTFNRLKEFADGLRPRGTKAFEMACRSALRTKRLKQRLEAERSPSQREFVREYRQRFGPLPEWMKAELPHWGRGGFQLLTRCATGAENERQFAELYHLARDVVVEGRMDGYRHILVGLIERRFSLDAFLVHTIDLLVRLADATHLDIWFDRFLEAKSERDIFGGALDFERYYDPIEDVDDLLRK